MFRPVCLFLAALFLAGAASAATITIDGNGSGRTFDGLGMCSSNGTSDLLFDYAEPYRSDILDFLFKPKFGASIQHLKVEAGSSQNTTEGSEASVAVNASELNAPVDRGYETWLIKEAVKRKPNILVGSLAWRFPRFVAGWGVYNAQGADFMVAYLNCLKNAGITLNYMSFATNEVNYDRNFVVNLLRPRMVQAGFGNMNLVGPDMDSQCWQIFNVFANDATFSNMVYAVAYHYDWDLRDRAPDDTAKNSGKRLWSSETHCYRGVPWQNALYCARGNNANYIDDKMTATINWLFLDAVYQAVGFFKNTCALVADQPAVGYYKVQPMLWAYAHTTQFTEAGWKYLDGACGQFVPGNRNGTYVTLRDTAGSNWSTIIVTQTATSLAATITGGLSTGPIFVWKSDSLQQFIQQSSITPVNGSFTISLAANSIYTLSTTTGQQKGTKTIPSPGDLNFPSTGTPIFPFPYYENYEGYASGSCMPRYHSDQHGTFEVYYAPDGRKCLRQIVTGTSSQFDRAVSAIGNNAWTNYDVVADVFVDSGEVGLGGRYAEYRSFCGIELSKDGSWRLHDLSGTLGGTSQQLRTGSISGFNGNAWHNLRVSFNGTTIEGFIDNVKVGSATQTARASGTACLSSTYNRNMWDNLYIGPVGSTVSVRSCMAGASSREFAIRRQAGTSRFFITYSSPYRGMVAIDVFNLHGEKVRSIARGIRGPGICNLVWDGKNDLGNAINPGAYVVTLKTASGILSRQVLN
jgi:galactosylceramidase